MTKKWQLIFTVLVLAGSCLVVDSKVFKRCELAKVLRQRHSLDLSEVAQWVCIAQHSSGFNTAAQAFSSSGGSHGLFQISDVYWCSPPGKGAGCNLPCHKLLDDNLSDDLACVKQIYEEHQRISGDGYTAFNAYQQFCQNNAASYIEDCFSKEQTGSFSNSPVKGYNPFHEQFFRNSIQDNSVKKSGKVYERCELARELHKKHKMPMQEIPTWVCIAEHESRFNTAAVGRLNADGSADHGLFQISDLYWCSHDHYNGGKACGLSCNKLLDNDITDDVRCIKKIHNEHIAISGDGFNAWSVYKPYCQNQHYEQIENCFENTQQTTYHKGQSFTKGWSYNQVHTTTKKGTVQQTPVKTHYNDIFKATSTTSSLSSSQKGKVYTRCSLAKELYFKHNFPIQDLSTWVCIAEHESHFNTATIGRLNTDGSTDHGLFQISDRYWCENNSYGGKSCNLPCEKLLDDDLRDDVACIKMIHEEHTRLSGNGFNAWTVYKPHCQNKNMEQIKSCFDNKTLASIESMQLSPSHNVADTKDKGKIYTKCELAKELYYKHNLPMEQLPKWVCIAKHESSYNTAAVGRLNKDGSVDHGIFQISDLYWCSHDLYSGKACNIPCHKFLDSDITDDVRCIKIIHEEHTRISGDGFNAWTVYQPYCHSTEIDYIKQCFTDKELKKTTSNSNSLVPQNSFGSKQIAKGKIYKKCELAQELLHKHHMPMEQIPKWVCIAQYESSYNTAAIGRLNTDGSVDHGLFQISDLYWCTHNQNGGKACNIPCEKLLDSDITDDVRCIKTIYEEHTKISGDGFNAWTVYKPHCRNTGISHIKKCFTEKELKAANETILPNTIDKHDIISAKNSTKGKIYKKCELAQELLRKHNMPMEQIPTWVCIAQHESSFNTGAVGRLNVDGSLDHGIFQISDLYWCSQDKLGGKACNIPCEKLLDSDIADDVNCINIIYTEHTTLSGDGFNAWTVYKPHCRNRKINDIRSCFTSNQIEQHEKKQTYSSKPNQIQAYQQALVKTSYSNNPFLSDNFVTSATQVIQIQQEPPPKTSYSNNPFLAYSSPSPSNNQNFKSTFQNEKPNYANNLFLKNIKVSTGSEAHTTALQNSYTLSNKQDKSTLKSSYVDNPFLNGVSSSLTNQKLVSKSAEEISSVDKFKVNPFLSGSIKHVKPTQSYLQYNPFLKSTSTHTPKVSKSYLNSNVFRTTTIKPENIAVKPPIMSRTTTRKPTTSRNNNALKTNTFSTTNKPNTQRNTSGKSAAQTNSSSRKRTTTTTTKKPTTTTTSWNLKSLKATSVLSLWQQKSTTKVPPTTWSWQNQKYQTSKTTKKPKQTSSTWNSQTKNVYKSTTTRKPTTSLYGTTTTTKKPSFAQKIATVKSTTEKYSTTKMSITRSTSKNPKTSTTKKSLTTTKSNLSWQNQHHTNNVTLAHTPINWNTSKGQTTKTPRTNASTTTRTSWNWRTTTKKPRTTTTTTRKPTQKITNNWWSTTKKTTTAKTTRAIRIDNNKATTPTKHPYYNNNLKTTTIKNPPTTTAKTKATSKSQTNTEYIKHKNDPFSHPFFSKVNELFKQLRSNSTTTKIPT